MANVVLNALQNFVMVLRAFNTVDQSVKTVKKLSEFESENWVAGDYFEVASRVGCITADTLSIHSEIKGRKLEKEIANLKKGIEKGTECIEGLKETLKTAEEFLKRIKYFSAIYNTVATGTYITAEIASGRQVQEVLLSSPALSRIGAAAGSVGTATAETHPNLSSAARIGGSLIDAGTLGTAVFANVQEYIVKANQVYQNYRMDVGQHNVVQMLSSNAGAANPLQVPLTVPPTNHKYTLIPEQYDNDPIFSQYVCPITNSVIRYPICIRDGQTNHYYELAAIYQWVHDHGTNPLTRGALVLQDLRVDLTVQRVIEDRMRIVGLSLS